MPSVINPKYDKYDDGGFVGSVSTMRDQNNYNNTETALQRVAQSLGNYNSLVDPATGKLKAGFALQGGPAVGMDTNIADNPWVKMMLQLGDSQKGQALDAVSAQGNAGLSSGYSALATRGGLSSGSRERLASKSAHDVLMGKQDVFRNADQNALGIMTQGTDKQLDLDMKNRAYDTDINKANVQTMIADKAGQDQFNLKKYEEQMKAWSAERTAEGQENAGKK